VAPVRGGPKVRATSIAVDPDDELAAEIPVRRAVERLREALVGRGFPVRMLRRFDADDPSSGRVLVAGRGSSVARAILSRAETTIPSRPEALGLVPGQLMGKQVLLACGADVRGLVYAVLEVADRVVHARDPIAAMRIDKPIVEEPANAVRSVARLFTSELYDKPWFHDEALWRRYLSELVAQRFNRFSLTLGLGYNLPRRVTDTYLYFAYPFLVPVPGHAVRVRGLPMKSATATWRCSGSSRRRRPRSASTSRSVCGRTRTSGSTARTPTTRSRAFGGTTTRRIAGMR